MFAVAERQREGICVPHINREILRMGSAIANVPVAVIRMAVLLAFLPVTIASVLLPLTAATVATLSSLDSQFVTVKPVIDVLILIVESGSTLYA